MFYFKEDIANTLRGLMSALEDCDLTAGQHLFLSAYVDGYRRALCSVALAFGIKEEVNRDRPTIRDTEHSDWPTQGDRVVDLLVEQTD